MDHLNRGWIHLRFLCLFWQHYLQHYYKKSTTRYILLCLLSIFFLRIILYITLCSHMFTVPFLHCDPALWLFRHSWLVYWAHLLCLCISSSKFFINSWKSKRWLDLKLKKFKAITGYVFFPPLKCRSGNRQLGCREKDWWSWPAEMDRKERCREF